MSEKVEKVIGIQIAKLRKNRGITQAELAELINVSIETVSRLERGVSLPSLKTLETIANALNVTFKDIFNFEYTQKSMGSEYEKEFIKICTYLKTKNINEIKMCYSIIKKLFDEIEKNYRPNK